LASVTVGGVVHIDPSAAATALGKALSTVELDELKQRLERILRESGKRVVVFIDDIDRLDRAEIQAMFKLVKLSAGFDYTSYVLAFDDEMVAAALGEKYGKGDIAAGRNFIEKIVQVPLHLPPAEEVSLRKLTFEGVDEAIKLSKIELSQEQVDAFVRHFVDGIEPRLNTPRQAKLYGNALAFALPILKSEANPVDQMLIEGIRVFYPKLYANIRDNPEYFLTERPHDGQAQEAFRDRAAELITEGLKNVGVDSDAVRRRLLEVLFPRLQSVLWGNEWDERWTREQRICSREYFKRYFSYSVPPGDVPDLKITSLIESLDAATDDDVNRALRSFVDTRGMPQ
jgi:predicted KAP-like P-loop ATPase